jgi:hypothetical protein
MRSPEDAAAGRDVTTSVQIDADVTAADDDSHSDSSSEQNPFHLGPDRCSVSHRIFGHHTRWFRRTVSVGGFAAAFRSTPM